MNPNAATEGLPEPIFPQRPELLTDETWPGDGVRHWTLLQQARHGFQGIHGNFER